MPLTAIGVAEVPADAERIANNGFWPDLIPAQFRAAHRLDGTVTPQRLQTALEGAMRTVNRLLADYQALRVADGVTSAAAIPLAAWQVAGHHAGLYRQAVYAHAHAWLLDRYPDVTATGNRDEIAAEARASAADSYRRDASWALSELNDEPHVTVELI